MRPNLASAGTAVAVLAAAVALGACGSGAAQESAQVSLDDRETDLLRAARVYYGAMSSGDAATMLSFYRGNCSGGLMAAVDGIASAARAGTFPRWSATVESVTVLGDRGHVTALQARLAGTDYSFGPGDEPAEGRLNWYFDQGRWYRDCIGSPDAARPLSVLAS